jgi:hypothetical protein
MSNSLKIFPVRKADRNYLQFDFEGDLTEAIASEGIKQWEDETNKVSDGQRPILFSTALK